MMTGFRKNCLPLVLTLVLCLGFATMSWAGPRGMGGGGCEWALVWAVVAVWAPAWVRAMAAA